MQRPDGFDHEVVLACSKVGIRAGERGIIAFAQVLDGDRVKNSDWSHPSCQFVKSVLPLPEDAEREIDLGWGLERELHDAMKGLFGPAKHG